jgi:hypothetical protein
MILTAHLALLRVETIRILLAAGQEKPDIAEQFKVSRQAIYSAVDRFKLDRPLQPLDKRTIASAPFLKLAVGPVVSQRLIEANIVATLLGRV